MTKDDLIEEIKRLELFFANARIPTGSIVTPEGIINNLRDYIDSNLAVAKANAGNIWFTASIERLRLMEQYIKAASG